jgi:signal transduction histidine kinase
MQEQVDAEIRVDFYPGSLVLYADREELRRIFINLIKNAFEATPENRVCRVLVTTKKDRPDGEGTAYAYTTVSVEGMGIPAEMQPRIFEPNFSSKTSGSGLGLAIVKKSVVDLQGEIGFETEANVGTTFWIRFPLAEK